MDKTQAELVSNINSLIENVWGLANAVRHKITQAGDIQRLRNDADRLEDLIQAYEALKLDILPNTTLWMAKEMINASRDITDGYARLQALDL